MSNRIISSLAIIKSREAPLDHRPIASQVQFISLMSGNERGESDGRSVFALLQNYARYSFEPLARLTGQTTQVQIIVIHEYL